MTWQQVMLLQVVAGSVLTLWYRRVTVLHKNNLLTLSLIIYACSAFTGLVVANILNGGFYPLPQGVVILYILGEGILIPISLMTQIKLLSHIGASSMAVAQTLNFLTVALFGVLILGDPLSGRVALGGILLTSAVTLVLSIRKVGAKKDNLSIKLKIILLAVSSFALGSGLTFEKMAIDSIGVGAYAAYGWPMQFLGASIIFLLLKGNKEKNINQAFLGRAAVAGLLTSMAGGLFILALSKGLLSSIILSSTAKVVLTSALAVWLLKERNDLLKRSAAVALAVMGLLVLFS